MNESLWLDEATTALVSRMSLSDIFTKFLPGDFHPPFYYVFMKFWVNIFGSSEIALRTPSLIFALLTVFIVYKLAGKFAALILGSNPLFIYYSQEARMYMMTAFLVTTLIYTYSKKRWVWFAFLLATLGMTDYIALFILPIFIILDYKNIKKLILNSSLLIISYLLWLPIFIKQLSNGLGVGDAWANLLGQPTIKNFLLIPTKFMIGRVSFDPEWLYGLIIIIIGGLYSYLLFRSISIIRSIRIIYLWLFVPVALGIIVSFWIPTLTYFRYLFVLPAFCILVAYGIGRSRVFLYCVVFLNILFSLYYIISPSFHREDWRSAAVAIGEDKIITPTGSQSEALIYYNKDGNIISPQDLMANRYSLVWLSRYVWQVFDPEDVTRVKIEELGYKKVGEYNFRGVEFYKYAYRN